MKSRAYINATPVPYADDSNVLSAVVSSACATAEGDCSFAYEGHTGRDRVRRAEDRVPVIAMDSAADGGDGAFDEIIVRYNESLHAFAYHILHDMDATEDVVQDTFLALWINREKMDFNLPLRNFLYVTTRNFAYRHLRTRRRFDNDLPPIPTEDQVSGYMVQEEAVRILKESIAQLPPRTAEVIRLSLEGMPQEQIAETMGVGMANVKRLKALGITKLKEIMGPLFSIIACLLQ